VVDGRGFFFQAVGSATALVATQLPAPTVVVFFLRHTVYVFAQTKPSPTRIFKKIQNRTLGANTPAHIHSAPLGEL
jgi:hypothetical protein